MSHIPAAEIRKRLKADWRKEALCLEISNTKPELKDIWVTDDAEQHPEARKYCLKCPVRKECLKDAMKDPAAQGVRAGYHFEEGAVTPEDARIALKEFKVKVRARKREPEDNGVENM